MELILGILIALLGLGLVIVIKLSTTFFHEMGHAVPALIFTDKPVSLYVGSYGDISNTLQFKIGRLQLYLKPNIMDWKIGMCRHEGDINTSWKRVLITLGGPIASLIVSIPLVINYSSIATSDFLAFFTIVFIGSACYDFLSNMLPTGTPINMHDGEVAYSDGYVLLALWNRRFSSAEQQALQQKFDDKQYEEVIAMGSELITSKPKVRYPYQYVIESMIETKEFHGALEVYGILSNHIELKDYDRLAIGELYKELGNYSEALKYFEQYRYTHYTDTNVLGHIGAVQVALGNHKEAIHTLSNLLEIDPTAMNARCHRAQALIHQREYDDAIADLQIVQQYDPNNPDLYFNLGLIDEHSGEYDSAISNYKQAKALNCTRHGLDYKIEDLKEHIIRRN
jgi:thioredoxin-like negative regulator of GroEL